MAACNNLGNAYYNGNGVTKDIYKAMELYKKVCDGGEIKECLKLGYTYYFGNGVAKDIYKAMKLFQKACDGGVIEGCNLLQKLN
jgi:beta-lactamase hcpA